MNSPESNAQSNNPNRINFDISVIEVEDAFRPYVKEETNASESQWQKAVRDQEWFWRKALIKRFLFGWIKWKYRRTQSAIAHSYSMQWQSMNLEQQLCHQRKATPCVWGARSFFARSSGIKRVHQLLMTKLLETLTPQKVLEVGAGNGINLFVLSSLFPTVQFSGCELTKGGVEAAKTIAMLPSLPEYIREFSIREPKDVTAHKRIDFKQGCAAELPYHNDQFDIVFTIQALEQMEEIRDQAIKELARVSNRYVVMIEPFRDWNTQPLNRHKIIALDYFSASISDLPKYGLQVIASYTDIPNKLGYGVGMVIAEKIVSPMGRS